MSLIFRRRGAMLFVALALIASVAATALPRAASAASTASAAGESLADRPPEDDMIYFVLIDRFANGDPGNDLDANTDDPSAYHGGDLQGVMDKLDYIRGLGFNTIWLTPVVDNQDRGYHGYWATDFRKVDEHLGTMETLQALVRQAHQRGIKVLLDVVVNHTGPAHPWVSDPDRQDWFHHEGEIFNWSDQENIERGDLAGLPDLAQENPATADYLIEMARWWVEQTDVDGFRLDTVRHVPHAFWQRFSQSMHSLRPGFFLMGEAWNDSPEYIAAYQKDGLDSLVDFPRQKAIAGVFAGGNYPFVLQDLQAEEEEAFPDSGRVATFIDNHDMPRFITGAGDNGEQKLRAALAYLFTARGIPILYYGTEVAMEGGSDPDNRRDMTFDANPELRAYVTSLTRVRQDLPALRRGAYLPVKAEPDSSVLAFVRTAPAGAQAGSAAGAAGSPGAASPVLVAINTGDQPLTATLTLPAEAGLSRGSLRNRLGTGGESLTVRSMGDGATVEMHLNPYQAMVLTPQASPALANPALAAVFAAAAAAAVVGLRLIRRRRRARQNR